MKYPILYAFLFFPMVFFAQEMLPLSLRQKAELLHNSWVKEVPFESVQTPNVGSTIRAYSVRKDNTSEMMISPEGGGLWYSQNGGETFVSLFENQYSLYINALAVNWESGTIWVATPHGLFSSYDKGKTFIFSGLSSVQNIKSIVINPKNTSEVIVGVFGNSYNADEKRGIFKTSDGGKTWQHKLFIGTRAGIDQIMETDGGKVLYATAWNTTTNHWESVPYGNFSSIYKSDDAGETWNKITQTNGFLNGNFIGRIKLAVYDKNTVYALVDNRSVNQRVRSSKSVEKSTQIHLLERDFETMSKSDFLSLDDNKLNAFLYNIGQNKKYSAQNLKDIIASDITSPARLMLFLGVKSQEVVGAEVYLTADGGNSWVKTHNQPLTDIFYQEGDEIGGIAVNSANKNHLFIAGYPILESVDAGKSWKNKNEVSLNNRFYSIDYQQNTLFSLTQNGFQISYDNAQSWNVKKVPNTSSFEKMAFDTNTFYLASKQGIFMKNNDVWTRILPQNQLFLGNKLYISNPNGTFYEYEASKNDLNKLGSMYFSENKAPLRFGMNAPLLISPQNKDILYAGSNKLHISMDKGKNWRTISEDLTNGDKKGNKPYGTISAIAESPFLFGLIYTGSDDGMIHLSNNGGVSWQQVYNSFPNPLKINNLIASRHNRNRVIATLVNTDENNREAFVFLSNDMGKTWQQIRSDLPEGRVNIIREDPKNEQILYIGTDNGLYVSFNLGETWQPFAKNLPETGILDIFIDENTAEMYVSTAGRGVFKTSVEVLQQLRVAITAQDFFPLQEKIRVSHSTKWGNTWNEWATPETPKIDFHVFSSKENTPISVKITKGKAILQSLVYQLHRGFNYIPYDLTISEVGKVSFEKSVQKLFLTTSSNSKIYLPKGKYTVIFSLEGGFEEERELEIY